MYDGHKKNRGKKTRGTFFLTPKSMEDGRTGWLKEKHVYY